MNRKKPNPSYLQEDHLVLGLGEGLQLVAPPPQLAELVLQASGQLLRMALGVALPRGDHLHQLRLTLLHHALQLGVHLPALLQLLLSARLQEERVRTERRLRANPCCYYIIFYFHHDFCRQAGCFPDKFSCNQNGKLFFLSLAAIVEQPELVQQGKMNEGSKEGKEEE